MQRRRVTILAALWAVVSGPFAALAAQDPVDLRRDLRHADLDDPIEEGVGDVSLLGTSLRRVEAGLISPIDFADVYRLPGNPAMLMRIAGGLYAVFPQSVYSEGGADIPPGTTFHIGAPSEMLPDAMMMPALLPELASGETEIEASEASVVTFLPPGEITQGWSKSPAVTIANSPLYRRERLRELMLEAVAGVVGDTATQASQDEAIEESIE